jgi:plasmid stabilization system protein ParE
VSYAVRWSRRALDALAEIWLANPAERAEISRLAASIDRMLRVNPAERGESREGDRRILFMLPLVVIFSVDNENRIVRILRIRHVRRRGVR